MRINNNKQNFSSLNPLAKPLSGFYNANATIPTLIIETGVTLGRAQQANKRGGMPEAVDRLIEQGIGAVAWIYGIKGLKSIGNFIGKKILETKEFPEKLTQEEIKRIKNFKFDIGFDELRNPIKNLAKDKTLKFAVGFKAANLLMSTALATYFMGAILPKVNNAILRKTLKKQQERENSKNAHTKMPSFKEFQKNTGKNISFTSLYDVGVNCAHVLENNSTARLLITDTGVIAGRFHNAKNKYRKIEAIFRDTSSIFFYLFSTPLIVKGLNKIFKNTNIDPKTLEKTVEHLQKSPEIVLKEADEKDVLKLKELFKDKKTISVDSFIDVFKDRANKANKMAQLQYFEGEKGFLSYKQALDVLSDSTTSDPEFLKGAYSHSLGKDISDKWSYVSSRQLDKIRKSIDDFVLQYKADGKSLEKVANKTIFKNFIFNCTGTAISIFALAFLIPKIQYAITQKMTNENKFHTEEE